MCSRGSSVTFRHRDLSEPEMPPCRPRADQILIVQEHDVTRRDLAYRDLALSFNRHLALTSHPIFALSRLASLAFSLCACLPARSGLQKPDTKPAFKRLSRVCTPRPSPTCTALLSSSKLIPRPFGGGFTALPNPDDLLTPLSKFSHLLKKMHSSIG